MYSYRQYVIVCCHSDVVKVSDSKSIPSEQKWYVYKTHYDRSWFFLDQNEKVNNFGNQLLPSCPQEFYLAHLLGN